MPRSRKPPLTERLATVAATRPRRTVAAWLAMMLTALVVVGGLLASALTPEFGLTNDPESDRAQAIIDSRLPQRYDVDEIVTVRVPDPGAAGVALRRDVEQLTADIRRVPGVKGAMNAYDLRNRALTSRDAAAGLILVNLVRSEEVRAGPAIKQIADLTERRRDRGVQAHATGPASMALDLETLSRRDLTTGELAFGIPAALVILVLVFGTLVAAAIPLLLGIVSIVLALAVTAVLGQVTAVSVFAVNMITGMGLALGIDYSLFVLSRYREERALGHSKLSAIAVAGSTSSRAVLFSGLVFVIALAGMLITPLSVLQSLAGGAIVVAVVAVAAALTVLPAILSLLGDRVEALATPLVGRRRAGAGREDRFWSAVTRRVMRRPVVSLVVATTLLLAAALPTVDLRIGSGGVTSLPDGSPSKEAFREIAGQFPGQSVSPVQVVVDGAVGSADVRLAIHRFERRLASDPRFGSQTQTRVDEARRFALVTVPIKGDPDGAAATDAVRDLRAHIVRAELGSVGATVLVGGATAGAVDYFDATNTWLPRVFVIVLGLSFILLTIAFRSIVVPIKAIVLNLLSVSAAYGLMVLVFQKGFAADLLGFQQVDALEAWVPPFLFSVLFALSMDYHVFLLSRIQERFQRTGDNTEAVAGAVASTARLITGAAVIMIAVFTGFALGDLVMFQQMGFGIAVALFLDATIVRSVLVPASMTLLGSRNWYLPSWLEWLPRIGVEGESSPSPVPVARRVSAGPRTDLQ
jgi:uncharacterized membrane protein YdfJ with MMPL/SSD domain